MADKVKYAGLDKAIAITATAFEGKFDKGGVPYINHCLHVMRGVIHLGTEAQIAAVFHDLLEDTQWTASELIAEGFDPRTVEVVTLCTHHKDEPYMDYIRRLSVSLFARTIKMDDLRHNSDIHRMKGLSPKDFERLAKYHTAYAYLRAIVE